MDNNDVISQFKNLPATEQWQVILTLSEKMQDIANQNDWQALLDIETRRKSLLDVFFSVEIPEALLGEVKTGIQAILESDKVIMEMGLHAQQEFSSNLMQVQQAKSAVTAYNSNR